jgi:protein-S-isoprenylcysteine O-methyltransferase Ste14
LFLIGWSVLNFLRAKGTPVPFNPPPQLVTTGPYAYTRNPMLTGVFSLLFGFSVFEYPTFSCFFHSLKTCQFTSIAFLLF